MTVMTEYAPGTFCWVDLTTTDTAGSRKFYTDLFGWAADDVPVEGGNVYTIFSKDGKQTCAQYEMYPDMREQGIPPHWKSYISVTNVDEAANKAGSLGGTVLVQGFDVMDVGRMAIIQDPTDATVALWEPKAHQGAELVNVPGTPCWNELYTKDTGAAAKFYANLFGWTSEESPSPSGATYTTFKNGERLAGGMLQIQKEMRDVPPHWAVYFSVEGCDATLERAQGMGAHAGFPPMDIPDVGRIAGLADPQGAQFCIIELHVPPD